MSNKKKRPFGLFLVALIAISAFVLAIVGIGSAPATSAIPSNICTTSNQACTPIRFISSAIGNTSSLAISQITSTSFSTLQNDTIVLLSTNPNGAFVKTISDSFTDTFTRNLLQLETGAPGSCAPVCQMLEIWTSKSLGTGTDAVTVNWNQSVANMFLIADYRNVASIGNVTGTAGAGTSLTFSITTEKSGSWITGGMGTGGVAGTNPCSTITPVPGTGLVQRIAGCSGLESPGLNIAANIADNSTALPNNTIFSFSETSAINTILVSGAIELIAVDQEPQNPNFNNFCTTTNGLCVTSQYKLNYANVATPPVNSGTVALASGTAYCTGVTTVGLTSRLGKPIQTFSNYGGFNRNVTVIVGGPALFIQTYVTTVAPSIVFAAGLCSASGNTVVSTATCLFLGSGGINAGTSCSVGMNGACCIGSSVIGTVYYGFIEITPENIVGHLQYNQVAANVNAMCNVALQEQA